MNLTTSLEKLRRQATGGNATWKRQKEVPSWIECGHPRHHPPGLGGYHPPSPQPHHRPGGVGITTRDSSTLLPAASSPPGRGGNHYAGLIHPSPCSLLTAPSHFPPTLSIQTRPTSPPPTHTAFRLSINFFNFNEKFQGRSLQLEVLNLRVKSGLMFVPVIGILPCANISPINKPPPDCGQSVQATTKEQLRHRLSFTVRAEGLNPLIGVGGDRQRDRDKKGREALQIGLLLSRAGREGGMR